MAQQLEFVVEDEQGRSPLLVSVSRVYNLGFTVRDQTKMQRHLEEMALAGIDAPTPKRPPTIFPISPWATIVDEECTVQYGTTNGEVEIVIVEHNGEIFVGVGSDHTDRELEKTDLPWSKQVAPNIIAPVLWRWQDVQDHWDQVVMESYVGDGSSKERYQTASMAEFWTPVEMLDSVSDRVGAVPGDRIFLSGTVVSEDGVLRYGSHWTLVMSDPVLSRRIEHTYHIVVLGDEIRE